TAWVQPSRKRDDGLARRPSSAGRDTPSGRRARGCPMPRRRRAMDHTAYTHTEADGYVQPVIDGRVHSDQPGEGGALGGRPADDRALEVVEGGIGAAAGFAVGAAVAGPIGGVVGIVVGGVAGLVVGELGERRAGVVTTTTNADFTDADGGSVAEASH